MMLSTLMMMALMGKETYTVGQDMSSTLPWSVQCDLSVKHDDALYTNDGGLDG